MDSLVIGAGFLGSKIHSFFNEKGLDTGATNFNKNEFYTLDITNKSEVEKFFSKHKPNEAVLCASFAGVDECESLPAKAREINVNGTKNVFEACKKINSKLVFISSDYVFDGEKGDYTEQDKTNPIQVYGVTKVEGENIVLSNEDNLVLRVSTLYGKSSVDKKTFERHLIENISSGKPVKVASDQITSPTLIDDVANAAFSLLQKNESGLFHTSGSEQISRHGFALKVAKKFSLDKNLIEVTTMDKLGFKALRPMNSSLSIKKLQKLNIKMSNVDAGLDKAKSEMNKVTL